MRRAVLLALVLVASPSASRLLPVARADDAEAQRLLREAYDRWKDETPDRCLALAEQALAAEPTTGLVRAQVLLFLGSLHQVKTGRLEDALACYDELSALLKGDSSDPARRLLAQALVRQANIVYAEHDDHEQALELLRQAQEALPLASTADMASQLCYRLGRGASDPAERARWLELALTLANEAIGMAQARPGARPGDDGGRGEEGQRRRKTFVARFRLQLTLVLEGLGREDEAAAAWAEVDEADLDENAHYQRALLHAVRGDLEQAGASLRAALATRPTAATRNQLRKFVRTEPDLSAGLGREDWRALVTDE